MLSVAYNENSIKLFEDIYSNLEKGYSAETLHYVNMIYYHFLSSLLYEEKFNDTEVKQRDDVVSKAVHLKQQKISSELSLERLASFSQLSVSHFSAIFKGTPQGAESMSIPAFQRYEHQENRRKFGNR